MRILVLHDSPADFESWLQRACPAHKICWATCPDQVLSALERAQPEIVFSIKHSLFPGQAHRPALDWPTVKWFHVGGSGIEHLGNWNPDSVVVTNSAGVLAPFHAERAMGALLALSTGLLEQRMRQEACEWSPTRFGTLSGKTLLIVGLGHTGLELARRAKAFGMRVWGVRRTLGDSPCVDSVFGVDELPNLWSQAHVLSLNVPLNDSTHHLVNAEVFRQLRGNCILLNGSRGPVVDPVALEWALAEGRLGGAWLDVTVPEPLPSDSPLWRHPRVIITPHCADQVADFPLRFAQFFVENLARYEAGEGLLNEVAPLG